MNCDIATLQWRRGVAPTKKLHQHYSESSNSLSESSEVSSSTFFPLLLFAALFFDTTTSSSSSEDDSDEELPISTMSMAGLLTADFRFDTFLFFFVLQMWASQIQQLLPTPL